MSIWSIFENRKKKKNFFFIFFKIAYMFEEFEKNVIDVFVHVFEVNSRCMRHVEYSPGPPEYSTTSRAFLCEKCCIYSFQNLHENLANSKLDDDQNRHFPINLCVL